MFENTVEQISNMKNSPKSGADKSSDVAFAIYYGKFQGIAPKANPIIALVESRVQQNVEYDILLNELHKIYLSNRASVSGTWFNFLNFEIFDPCFGFLIDYDHRNRIGHHQFGEFA